jgi:hypothetical protein
MNISTSSLGQPVFYLDSFNDTQEYPICCFGKVDSVTISATDESKYITIIDNKGRKTNFAHTEVIKTYNLNALDIQRLQSVAHEKFMQSLYK